VRFRVTADRGPVNIVVTIERRGFQVSKTRYLRSALFLGAAAAATLSLSTAALAQQSSTETVVVTGSRIPVANFVSNSPLQTVTAAEIQAVGTSTVESYLDSLPQFSPAATKTQNNPPYGGSATLDLRQLGSNRTLVLLDGHRIVPGFSGGSVDVSILPPGLIDRVEIITGGASAVYGSDAVAGVVNFITKRDFEGVLASVKYGQADIGDAQEYTVDALIGGNFAGGKGNAVLAFSYDHRAKVGEGARAISARAEACYTTGCVASGSPTVPDGRISVLPTTSTVTTAKLTTAWNNLWASAAYGSHAPGSIPLLDTLGSPNIGFNPDGTIFSLAPVTNYKGPFKGYDPAQYSYNFNPDNLLQLPFERYNFNGKAYYDVFEKTELYANLLVTRYTSYNSLAPAPNSLRINTRAVDTNTGQTYLQEFSPDFYNMLISAGYTDATLPTALRVSRRSNELGPRRTDFDTFAYQGTIGLNSEVPGLFGKTWKLDAFASLAAYKADTYAQGFLSASRVTAAAAGCPSTAPTDGVGACVPVDPFGAGSITADQIAYLEDPYYDNALLTQQNVEANLSGELIDLPYGPIGFSVGTEYRAETYKDVPDVNLQSGDVGAANVAVTLQGGYSVIEGYGEAKAPLLSGLEFANYLGVEGGIRYSSYSTGVTSWTYKWGGEYSPTEGIRFRGLVQRAIRAPSVGELYQQQAGDYPSAGSLTFDPCSVGSPQRTGANAAAVLALCKVQASAIDFSSFVSTFNSSTQLYGVVGGNPNLKPETAHTWTLGMQINPPASWVGDWASNFNASIDYYHINVRGAIGTTDASTSLDRCFDPTYNPSFNNGVAYCQAIHRDPGSGGLTSITAPDGWIAENSANLGGFKLRGIDFQAAYGMDVGDLGAGLGDLGVFTTEFTASWMMSSKQEALPGDPFYEYSGTIGNGTPGQTALPKWKHSMRFGWQIDPVTVNLRWYHIGHVYNLNAQGNPTYIDHIAPYDYFYLDLNYQMFSNMQMTFGVDNLFDKHPPRFTGAFQYNTDPSTYDVIGRFLYFRVTVKN